MSLLAALFACQAACHQPPLLLALIAAPELLLACLGSPLAAPARCLLPANPDPLSDLLLILKSSRGPTIVVVCLGLELLTSDKWPSSHGVCSRFGCTAFEVAKSPHFCYLK
ncbi:hypothetical protein E3N88_00905 [Mikania micrantha]|uniref:Secreted protein n=1 Tax=Mikania micrantha TaxID=192012 RepID=A0A5N6PZH2_9ASTR|nr:hypothetical protein E3N88_00905 [Mikania micrantha]